MESCALALSKSLIPVVQTHRPELIHLPDLEDIREYYKIHHRGYSSRVLLSLQSTQGEQKKRGGTEIRILQYLTPNRMGVCLHITARKQLLIVGRFAQCREVFRYCGLTLISYDKDSERKSHNPSQNA